MEIIIIIFCPGTELSPFLFMCVHLLTTSFQRLCCGFHSLKLCESRGGRPGLSFQLSGSETVVVVVVLFLLSSLQKVWVLIRLWKPQHSRWKEDVVNKCTHINKKGLSSVPGQKQKNLRLGSDGLGLVYVWGYWATWAVINEMPAKNLN